MHQPGAPSIVPQPPPPQDGSFRENYRSNISMGLGITHIIIGLFCILFNCIGIAVEAAGSGVYTAIATAIFFILTGIFGIVAARAKTVCLINTFMIMSIISALLFCCILVITASNGMTKDETCYYYNTCTRLSEKLAMNGLLMSLALLEATVSIISSVICCMAVCRCHTAMRNQGMVVTTVSTSTSVGHPVQQQTVGLQPQYPQQQQPPLGAQTMIVQNVYQQTQYPPPQYPPPTVGVQPNYTAEPARKIPLGEQESETYPHPPSYGEVVQASCPPLSEMDAQGSIMARPEAYNPDYRSPPM